MRKHRRFCVEKLEPRTLLSGWSTVDDFSLTAGKAANSGAMVADNTGNVYAAGIGQNSAGTPIGVVREKASGGSSWTTIEQFNYADGQGVVFDALSVDASGDLYVGGTSLSGHWLVLEKPASPVGSPFSIIDDVPPPSTASGSSATVHGLAVDGNGDVFAVGNYQDLSNSSSPVQTWVVRRQVGTAAFTTVDSFSVSNSGGGRDNQGIDQASSVTVIASGPNAGVYVVGQTSSLYWIVRKSNDGGNTWSTVDDFQYDAGSSEESAATAVAVDAAGNVYVVGYGSDANSTDHWLVRQSTNGGASWMISDDYELSLATGSLSMASAVGTDSGGNVYVAGRAKDASGLVDGIIRTNATGTWETVDDYQPGFNTMYRAWAADTAGNLYASGSSQPAKGVSEQWIVRSAAITLKPFSTTVSGVATYALSAVVGSFTDSDPNARLSNYSSTINWGDGNSSTGTIAFNSTTRRYDVSGAHTYAAEGTYTIAVIIRDTVGVGTAIKSTADIIPPGPTPQITGNSSVNEGSSYSLNLSSTDAGGQAIVKWLIDWGDGVVQQLPGSAIAALHVYDDGPASELISATATDAKGFSAAASLAVMVEDVAPTAIFSATSLASPGAFGAARFTSVFDPSMADTIAGFRYSFDWDNDGVFEVVNSLVPTAPIPANYLATPGPHVIRGRIADKDGSFTDYTTTIQVLAGGAAAATLSAASQISAGAFFSSLGVQADRNGTTPLEPGDWLCFAVDFGGGVKKAKMQLSAAAAKTRLTVQLRLDDPTGQIVASFSRRALAAHGQTTRSTNVTGVHNLYLEVGSGQAEVNWFSFVPIVAKHKHGRLQ